MFKHILLPTDGSEPAGRAIARGVELARLTGAEVTVMTAVERFPQGIMGGVHHTDDQTLLQAAEQAAAVRLDQAEQVVKAAGVPCHRVISHERTVHQSILQAAQLCGADLIVMGTHGLGAIERLFVGSQTQRVLAHTQIPVLTLH